MRDRSQARCVLVQPQVATVLVIVADVSSHEPDEMTCAENHDVLKELATAAADPPLRGSVLPFQRPFESAIAVGYVFQFSGRSCDGLEDHAELHLRIRG